MVFIVMDFNVSKMSLLNHILDLQTCIHENFGIIFIQYIQQLKIKFDFGHPVVAGLHIDFFQTLMHISRLH